MRALTTAEMREADRRAIEEVGIPGVVLMNNAGAAVYEQVPSGSVAVICGKGNNGGDGLVVARLALLDGHRTMVILLAEPDSITGDSRVFLDAYRKLGGHFLVAATENAAWEAMGGCGYYDTIVDAVLGTGIDGDVSGVARAAIDAWPNDFTVSVDIPSGMNADTGAPCGACVKANKTVTFQFPKRGFESPDAAEYLGELVIADIGIPGVCADDEAWNARTPA